MKKKNDGSLYLDKSTHPVLDSHRVWAQEIVSAVWMAQINQVARWQLSIGPQRTILMMTPDWEPYDAVAAILAKFEANIHAVMDQTRSKVESTAEETTAGGSSGLPAI